MQTARQAVHQPDWVSGLAVPDGLGSRLADTGARRHPRRKGVFRDLFSTYELLAYLSCRAPKLGYRCIELPTIRRYPATGQVPTKISSVSGNFSVLQVLIRACLGAYNPAR